QDADPAGRRGALRGARREREHLARSPEAEASRRDPRDEAWLEEGDRPGPRGRDDRDLRGGTSLVRHPATSGGAWPAITRRHAASSVAPGLVSPNAPCVLAWLGASDPGIHQCDWEAH